MRTMAKTMALTKSLRGIVVAMHHQYQVSRLPLL